MSVLTDESSRRWSRSKRTIIINNNNYTYFIEKSGRWIINQQMNKPNIYRAQIETTVRGEREKDRKKYEILISSLHYHHSVVSILQNIYIYIIYLFYRIFVNNDSAIQVSHWI